MGQMPILVGHPLRGAEAENARVKLQLTGENSQPTTLIADHVIASTGYRFNFQNLPFLDEILKSQIRHEEQMPQLSSNFESSVPGLYFTGLASAYSFGPVMRFIAGTGFAARRISTHIAKDRPSTATRFINQQKCLES